MPPTLRDIGAGGFFEPEDFTIDGGHGDFLRKGKGRHLERVERLPCLAADDYRGAAADSRGNGDCLDDLVTGSMEFGRAPCLIGDTVVATPWDSDREGDRSSSRATAPWLAAPRRWVKPGIAPEMPSASVL